MSIIYTHTSQSRWFAVTISAEQSNVGVKKVKEKKSICVWMHACVCIMCINGLVEESQNNARTSIHGIRIAESQYHINYYQIQMINIHIYIFQNDHLKIKKIYRRLFTAICYVSLILFLFFGSSLVDVIVPEFLVIVVRSISTG